MKRALCLTLICGLTSGPLNLAAQDQATGVAKGAVLAADGVISGTVSSSAGRKLSGIKMHLLDPRGTVLRKTVTTRDGDFKFAPSAYDSYTVQCMDEKEKKVLGTEKVTLSQPAHELKMVCTTDAAAWWKESKWGLLAGLGAAAAAVGAAAVIAKNGDASGSR